MINSLYKTQVCIHCHKEKESDTCCDDDQFETVWITEDGEVLTEDEVDSWYFGERSIPDYDTKDPMDDPMEAYKRAKEDEDE